MNTTRVTVFAALAVLAPATARAEELTKNHPPRFGQDYDDARRIKVGSTSEVVLQALDPENDPVTFHVAGLPRGMFTRSAGDGLLAIRWRPRKEDVGSHDLVVTATDSHGNASDQSISFLVEDEWQSFFMPGVSYVVHSPVDRATWGVFQGVSAEILLAAWIRRNENRGPSHGRVYLDMDLLRSSRPGTPAAFDLAVGFDLSIERNPVRHWLLPYFGMKTGAFIQRDLTDGSVWHATPTAGAYLWADKNLLITASAGYMLPISAARFDELRGVRAMLGANFSLW